MRREKYTKVYRKVKLHFFNETLSAATIESPHANFFQVCILRRGGGLKNPNFFFQLHLFKSKNAILVGGGGIRTFSNFISEVQKFSRGECSDLDKVCSCTEMLRAPQIVSVWRLIKTHNCSHDVPEYHSRIPRLHGTHVLRNNRNQIFA